MSDTVESVLKVTILSLSGSHLVSFHSKHNPQPSFPSRDNWLKHTFSHP